MAAAMLPVALTGFSPPAAAANQFMRLFHTVAATVDCRVPKIEKGTVSELSEEDKWQLCLWVTQVKKSPRPHYADPDQWRLKLDLLCALAWILAPTACLQEKLPVPAGKSFLFYATKLITDAQEFERWKSIIGKPEFEKFLIEFSKSNDGTWPRFKEWTNLLRPFKTEP